jgi:NRPS condensation-like uncharacterized protein
MPKKRSAATTNPLPIRQRHEARTILVGFKVNEQEMEQLKKLATHHDVTVSDMIRLAINNLSNGVN